MDLIIAPIMALYLKLLSLLFPLIHFLLSFVSTYRSLGQEVYLSVQEADYEIARYARQHGSMGILGQDSDFIIYDRFVQVKEFFF